MHGNTETTAGGVKTRRFDNILAEVDASFRIHEEEGSMLGGVHIELTGEDVTECIGGARGLTELDLARAYKSQVDPTLKCRAGARVGDVDRPARRRQPVTGKTPKIGHLSVRDRRNIYAIKCRNI